MVGFPFLILYNLSHGKYSNRLVERLGRYPQSLRAHDDTPNSQPIWVHAASVGEVKAAIALTRRIKELLPLVPVLVSTITPAGRDTAERLTGKEIPIIYFPLDFYPCVKRAVKFIRPRAFIALETELWPNFLFQAHKSGCILILANGRISLRSFKRYRIFRFLFQPVLEKFKVLMVRDSDDAAHFRALGAVPERIRVFGNIKYEGLLGQTKENLPAMIRERLKLPEGRPVIVAGSTRGGEEAVLLAVYNHLKVVFPGLILILVPRHINRCPEIENLFKTQGVSYQLYSRIISTEERPKEAVILVDRIGDLFALYSVATLVFCGASLVPKGGQNIFEPAAWGKLVFYGPHMEDFKDARRQLEEVGAGIMVRDREELEKQMAYYLEHPEERARRGEAGREILKAQTGLTKKAAEIIAEEIRN
ncbi:MAG: 3-deoxy-D-manno-octulosonic acid transferase [Deltaproteobacteria bacterium]|nr:3-deoxy-D-manno-octulosonic acid transferase [Deltaproteobacteria bacterium]